MLYVVSKANGDVAGFLLTDPNADAWGLAKRVFPKIRNPDVQIMTKADVGPEVVKDSGFPVFDERSSRRNPKPSRRISKTKAKKSRKNPRKRSAFKPPYTVQTWFERDRQHVELQDSLGATVVEWWDDDVSQAVEDGFLDPRNYLKSATEYAREMGIIS